MDSDSPIQIAKAGACVYILHGLLQRLEAGNSGLVESMLIGAQADRTAIEASGSLSEPVRRIFEETSNILQKIHAQNQMR